MHTSSRSLISFSVRILSSSFSIKGSTFYSIRVTPLLCRKNSTTSSVSSNFNSIMAPPKSATQFLDFVNASPTRKHGP